MEWDKAFKTFIKKLDDQKPIIYTGDLNVAHNPIGQETHCASVIMCLLIFP